MQDHRLTIVWASKPGKTYQVQSKHLITDDAWADWGNPVLAVGEESSISMVPGDDQQEYYRIWERESP